MLSKIYCNHVSYNYNECLEKFLHLFCLTNNTCTNILSYPHDLHKLVNVYSVLDMIFILLLLFTFIYFHTQSEYFLVLTQGSKSIVICIKRIVRKFKSSRKFIFEKKYRIIIDSYSVFKWLGCSPAVRSSAGQYHYQ